MIGLIRYINRIIFHSKSTQQLSEIITNTLGFEESTINLTYMLLGSIVCFLGPQYNFIIGVIVYFFFILELILNYNTLRELNYENLNKFLDFYIKNISKYYRNNTELLNDLTRRPLICLTMIFIISFFLSVGTPILKLVKPLLFSYVATKYFIEYCGDVVANRDENARIIFRIFVFLVFFMMAYSNYEMIWSIFCSVSGSVLICIGTNKVFHDDNNRMILYIRDPNNLNIARIGMLYTASYFYIVTAIAGLIIKKIFQRAYKKKNKAQMSS